ncbi:MAG: glycosyltransferase family 4 protein [Chloroflexi bacterium]|nr:glycosyltransferase family 4 protein [Chloroflexota bacterium]
MNGPAAERRVAYIVTRFPKLTETFVLFEILALQRAGVAVDLFALVRHREAVRHPEADRLISSVRFPSVPRVVVDQARWLARAPRRYLGTWRDVVVGNRKSIKFLVRAVVTMPVAASFALHMRREGVEHMHAHWATHGALAAFVVHRLTGIPYSFTAHAHDIYVQRPMLERKIAEAAFVVTISDYNVRFLGDLYPDQVEKLRMVRCGVDLSVFRAGRPTDLSAPPIIVCVASLQPQKGHRVLLDALHLLRGRGIDLSCVLVGDGPEREALIANAERLGLRDAVTFAGSQPQGRVAEILQAADVAIQPSITLPSGKMEGIPVALMEALASGLPVVASRLSGIPELVRHEETGLLVPEGDAPALADALERLLLDGSLRERLSDAGRQAVVRQYDLDENAERLRDLIVASFGARSRQSPDR